MKNSYIGLVSVLTTINPHLFIPNLTTPNPRLFVPIVETDVTDETKQHNRSFVTSQLERFADKDIYKFFHPNYHDTLKLKQPNDTNDVPHYDAAVKYQNESHRLNQSKVALLTRMQRFV